MEIFMSSQDGPSDGNGFAEEVPVDQPGRFIRWGAWLLKQLGFSPNPITEETVGKITNKAKQSLKETEESPRTIDNQSRRNALKIAAQITGAGIVGAGASFVGANIQKEADDLASNVRFKKLLDFADRLNDSGDRCQGHAWNMAVIVVVPVWKPQ
jgi:hypothetical protein